ncbi:hypothetical protein [Amycolatopsis anabasis]|uniref:hypothetical protein n=1 Tax=Amycolatopsis anabasis TaxID=1840409 RepID=UPI00131CED96|nr:hypothetical protein [Amycolatopsis anabasis]
MTTPWAGLVDDAALFPPGNAPLPEAVPAHHAHHAAWYAELVGPFVFPATRLGELPGVRDLKVSLTAPAGPDGLAEAVRAVTGADGLELAAIEAALPAGTSLSELTGVLAACLPPGAAGYVEVPRGANRSAVLDALAGTPYRAKFRTGGLTADAFPDEPELADAVAGCVRRDLPFKCTAGLHHAIRHTAPDTGFEHHGFLNVLLATDAALAGADPADLVAILAEREKDRVRDSVAALAANRLAAARRLFLSIGSCSVAEPVDDLVGLGLLTAPEPHGDR